MIADLGLMRPSGLPLRAACGGLSRSARLMIGEIAWRRPGVKFKFDSRDAAGGIDCRTE
jgi:hypothetical protein